MKLGLGLGCEGSGRCFDGRRSRPRSCRSCHFRCGSGPGSGPGFGLDLR